MGLKRQLPTQSDAEEVTRRAFALLERMKSASKQGIYLSVAPEDCAAMVESFMAEHLAANQAESALAKKS